MNQFMFIAIILLHSLDIKSSFDTKNVGSKVNTFSESFSSKKQSETIKVIFIFDNLNIIDGTIFKKT